MRFHSLFASCLVLAAAGCGSLLGLGDFEDAEDGGGGDAATGGTGATNAGGTGASGAASVGGMGGDGGSTMCEPGTMVTCYTGEDPTTADVGLCASGMALCTDEGVPGEPCEGEVLPAVEDCSVPDDEDCNGFACSEVLWAYLAGDADRQTGEDIAVDRTTGEVVVVGSFWSSLDLPGKTLIANNRDGFIAKHDPDGNLLWDVQIEDDLSQYVLSVDIDSQGNVVVVGLTSSGQLVDLGDGPVGPSFLAKYDKDGTYLWSLDCTLPNGGMDDVVVDPEDDSIIITASFRDTATCGVGNHTAADTLSDILIAKFSPTGVPVWSKAWTGNGNDGARAIAAGPGGYVAVAGYFSESINFGGSSATTPGSDRNGFVARVDSAGTVVWNKNLGINDSANQEALAVAIDSAGGVTVGGYFSGTVIVPTLDTLDTGDLFLISHSASGTPAWAEAFTTSRFEPIRDLAFDQNDDLHVVGSFNGSLAIGAPQPLTGNTSSGYFAKLAGDSGAHRWSKVLGDLPPGEESGAPHVAVALGAAGEVHVTGIGFGIFPLTDPAGNAQGQDLFVAKLAP